VWWRRVLVAAMLLTAALITPILALRWIAPPASAYMAAAWLQELHDGRSTLKLHYEWVPRTEISPTIALAVIAAEDQRFKDHSGFDLREIEAAFAAREAGLRGASTLTQQVARNLFLWSSRSWLRKALEAWITLWIEVLWEKRRILEMYLNIAQFGRGIYGVGAAAEVYFKARPRMLTSVQAARLAAVLPSPLRYEVLRETSYTAHRRRWIETQMRQLGPAYLSQLAW